MTGSTGTGATSLFDRLRQHARRVEVDGQTFWRVEGDLLLGEEQLKLYAQEREAAEDDAAARQAAGLPLVAMVDATGRIIRWAPDVVLTYAVLRRTFERGKTGGYELVVDCMQKATADWEQTCGVAFRHVATLDDSDTLRPAGALFVVREVDVAGQFIASAFFPNDPVHRRWVLIDPSFYSPSLGFDVVGVLRHELGHTLGFRHEHIRSGKPPGCPDEDTYGTIDLNDYDPQSVMHYFCGGLGSRTLAISDKDRAAAQYVYGQPLKMFELSR